MVWNFLSLRTSLLSSSAHGANSGGLGLVCKTGALEFDSPCALVGDVAELGLRHFTANEEILKGFRRFESCHLHSIITMRGSNGKAV
jgi:hypothetical protein